MVNVAVVGATGYAGSELIRLLVNHPNVKNIYAGSRTYKGKAYSDVYPNFKNIYDETLYDADIKSLAEKADVLFLSLPHGISSFQIDQDVLNKCVVIDLGADFRLKDVETYKKWYQSEHGNISLLESAVYGLCEINREKIKQTKLIANPGCYTTATLLLTYPLVKENLIDVDSLVIDAKSGISGAGRAEKLDFIYTESSESIKPYGVTTHRHTPEIEQELTNVSNKEVVITFTPHLIPMNRGILVTSYAKLKEGVTDLDIENVFLKYYKDEKFIRLLEKGVHPQTRWVKGSNYTDISWAIDQRTKTLVSFSALDNIVKGAAGQAVQNMNIVCGFDEASGLNTISPFPI
ncbi:MAG: N-acetyl-gamma-glutamyl-phosphate reductase [Sphaerochaetaceae bacterium]